MYEFQWCRAALVDSALKTGAIYEGDGFKYIKEALPNGTLHLMGLLSDGGVHSRIDQTLVCHFCHQLNSNTWIVVECIAQKQNFGLLRSMAFHVVFETFTVESLSLTTFIDSERPDT